MDADASELREGPEILEVLCHFHYIKGHAYRDDNPGSLMSRNSLRS